MKTRSATLPCRAGLMMAALSLPVLAMAALTLPARAQMTGTGPNPASLGGGHAAPGMAGSGTNGAQMNGMSNPNAMIPPDVASRNLTGVTTAAPAPGPMIAPGTGVSQPLTGVPTAPNPMTGAPAGLPPRMPR